MSEQPQSHPGHPWQRKSPKLESVTGENISAQGSFLTYDLKITSPALGTLAPPVSPKFTSDEFQRKLHQGPGKPEHLPCQQWGQQRRPPGVLLKLSCLRPWLAPACVPGKKAELRCDRSFPFPQAWLGVRVMNLLTSTVWSGAKEGLRIRWARPRAYCSQNPRFESDPPRINSSTQVGSPGHVTYL